MSLITKCENIITRYRKWWNGVDGGFRVDVYRGATVRAEPPSSYHKYLGTVVIPTIDIRGCWGSSTSPWKSTPWSTIDPRPDERPEWASVLGCPPRNWTLVFEGWVFFSGSGKYLIATWSDDGIRVYIDGVKVIDDYTFHAPRQVYNYYYIERGWHKIRVVFFEGGGQWVCMVGFKLGGLDLCPISILNTKIYPV